MIDIVIAIIVVFLVIAILIGIVKNTVTFINHGKIIDAIHLYRMQCLYKDKEPLVSHEDMESYDSTLFRLWDWGYKHILPPEKFEIIKTFINISKHKKEK